MRKVLLATVMAASISTASAPARADIVFDPTIFAQNAYQNALEWAQWAKEVGHYVKETAQWVEVLGWYKRQWDTAVSTYNALAHVTDLRSAASAVGGLTRNYMPEANSIPQLMSDVNTLWGSAGSYNAYDLYYQSRVLNRWGDRWTDEMERKMVVTSNAKAMAEASSLSYEQSLANLDILQARLSAAQDVTEVAAVNGLISLEAQNLQVHQAQAQNVALLLAADDRVTRQREEQIQRESADLLFLATSPMSDLR
jgi:hypothetical protein